jgi:hypothetical protein
MVVLEFCEWGCNGCEQKGKLQQMIAYVDGSLSQVRISKS